MNELIIAKKQSLGNVPDLLPTYPKGKTVGQNSYVHLGRTNKHSNIPKREGNFKLKRRILKSEALQIRLRTREKLVEHLNSLGQEKIADSIAICGDKFEVLTCGQHIPAKLPFHRCNVRYCPMCASRRASKYVNKYLPYALDFVKFSPVSLTPCLLTLTQVKIKGEKLAQSRKRLMLSFRKFIRPQFFNTYFSGGLYAVENTFSESGNHTHLHLVVFRRKFVDHKLLKERWAMVSAGALNLNIKLIDTLENGLKECIKYISKPLPAEKLERSHIAELLELKGQRMLDTFGDFRKFCQSHELPETEKIERPKLEENQCCPNCDDSNNKLFRLTMSVNELIDFHRRIEISKASPPMRSQ